MGSIPNLAKRHEELIRASAINDEVAAVRGYRTIDDPAELGRLGFAEYQLRPGLLIPIVGVDGDVTTYQLRSDEPRMGKDGRPIRYETRAGDRLCLDVPRQVRPVLANPGVSLWITEGARKLDSAISHGLPCIGLLGVEGWRGTNPHGGKTELPDWSAVALNRREVFIAFDSDVMTKQTVRDAVLRFAAFLERKKATVRFVVLPTPVVEGSRP